MESWIDTAEAARVRALHECDVVNTPAEQAYDDVTRLAAAAFGTPIALVNLVDQERVWFKSRVGVTKSEAPRERTFCDHTVRGAAALVVADATLDPRFCDHPLVVGEPHLRFYAGVPVVVGRGHAVGTVCVLDTVPHAPTEGQIETLRALARQVGSHLELRRQVRNLERTRAALDEARRAVDLIVEASCDGNWELHLHDRSLQLSGRAFSLLGLPGTSGALPLAVIVPLLHGGDLRALVRHDLRRLLRGETVERELRFRGVDHTWHWIRLRALHVRDKGGEARVVGSIADVDASRRANDDLQRLSRLLEESQALARIGGWEYDVAEERLVWTRETYRIHGQVPGVFQPTLALAMEQFVPESGKVLRDAVALALASGRAFALDLQLCTGGGNVAWCRVSGGAVIAGGRVTRLVGAIQDISEQRRLSAELWRAKEAAESASQAKSAFLATVSHEIRTPLHTVLGYADMLRDSSLDEQQRESVEVITSAGATLLRLIDDILEFSKAEAGKLQLEPEQFDPMPLLHDVARMLQAAAQQKGLVLRVDGAAVAGAGTGGAGMVFGDRRRVGQVLVNLVGNAVKFTATGEVVLTAQCFGERVRVSVRDTGIGIPAAQQPALFDDFVQADSSMQRRFGGTGLGLAISKRFVEAMGGTIGVDSTPGEGATFWFTLPVAQRSAVGAGVPAIVGATEAGVAPAAFAGRRVLVADDNRMNLRLATRLLEGMGFVVEAVGGGGAATERATSRAFDLVLMDCQMPDVDGFDATRRIREHERDGARRTPILALTANALPEDRDACLAAGMDDVVSKPFTRRALVRALQRWLPDEPVR